jgi:hypothetical protein
LNPGDVIPYLEMCRQEGVSLQRGMNFRLKGRASVILMSLRPGAPYADRVEDQGRILIYEGHDAPRSSLVPDPKQVDQPDRGPAGSLTQNGRFYEAAKKFQRGEAEAELVKVYEKIRQGIWVFSGVFRLTDAWRETMRSRTVFKFKLELLEQPAGEADEASEETPAHDRLIPTPVKLEVWKRDQGKCRVCGSRENLHFDHIIPYSKGGSSFVADNIQILCAKHNLLKRDRIE